MHCHLRDVPSLVLCVPICGEQHDRASYASVVTEHAPEIWPQAVVEHVARVLGDTATGLTGSEIGQLLAECNMADPDPTATKWKRLYAAFIERYNLDGGPKRLVTFVTKAMAPVRYTASPSLFTDRQGALDEVLVHVGLRLNDEGSLARGAKATTLSEAAQHANRVRTELRRRGTHAEVLRYYTQEILERNAFHATLEAAKSVADRLRSLTGVGGDGSALVDATLVAGQRPKPRVTINACATHTDRDEQNGFANLCRGLFGMFRNPTAHDPRITRTVSDDELLETLTLASLLHRRLDTATMSP